MKTLRLIITKGLFVIAFAACIFAVLYPLISNYLYDQKQDQIITEYTEEIKTMDTARLTEEFDACYAYNQSIIQTSTVVTGGETSNIQFTTQDPLDVTAYEERLNISGNGVMGYIMIPKININLPISHYATDEVLDSGVGHLPESSLPVGGESCHSVLTGHTGSTDKIIFTDLEKLVLGDCFFLSVLDETLVYEVDQIITVLPYEVKDLMIVEGEDLCTLVTCTPYGINSHRLLVRGRRVPVTDELLSQLQGDIDKQEAIVDAFTGQEETYDFSRFQQYYLKAVLVGCVIALIMLIIAVLINVRRIKKEEERAKTAGHKEAI